MAFKYGERIQESSTSTGTGDLVLAGVPDSTYQLFSSVFTNGDTTDVAIFGSGGFESCRATYNTGANSITRGTIYASSNAGASVNFSAGTKTVIVSAPGGLVDDIIESGLRYNAQALTAAQQQQARTNVSAPLKGHIFGLTCSNNGTDATNDIDIAVGQAASTETNPVLMVLASALTKRLDAAWAVGTNQGGLDTGSIANTTYHVWLIQRSDTGVVDVLFSASATAPTMPANYDRKRRIMSFMRLAGVIVPFVQVGDLFYLVTNSIDVNAGSTSASATLVTLGVPDGINVTALFALRVDYVSGSNAILVTSPSQSDQAAATANQTLTWTSTLANVTSNVAILTNTSRQIRTRSALANGTYYVTTSAWIDRRGRDGGT